MPMSRPRIPILIVAFSHPDRRYIAGRIIEAKSFDMADAVLRKAIGEQALALLRSYRKRGTVEQIGLGRGVRWKLASEA